MKLSFSFAFAMLVVTHPVAARAADNVRLQVAEVSLELPLPAGYCVPSQKDAAWAQIIAASDTDNVTLATLVACGPSAAVEAVSDYVLIKAPRTALLATVEKGETLAAIHAVLTGPDAPQFDAAMQQEVEKGFNSVTNADAKFGGRIAGAGRDEDCVYLAGSVNVGIGNTRSSTIVVTCLTVAGQKVVSINSYAKSGSIPVDALKARARSIALTITGG